MRPLRLLILTAAIGAFSGGGAGAQPIDHAAGGAAAREHSAKPAKRGEAEGCLKRR